MDSNTATSSGDSATTATSQKGGEHYTRPKFIPECCLFCNKQLDDIETNQLHMQTTHGLFIPSRDKLLVDLDTLFDYLHLVIFGYNECINCGTQRNTPLAAQQHMVGKNHCRFDIDGEGSEFADFYDFSEPESEINEDDADEEANVTESNRTKQTTWTDETSMRLPSGKIISSRPDTLSGPPRPKRIQRSADTSQYHSKDIEAMSSSDLQQHEEQPATSTSVVEGPGPFGARALTRSEKRETAFTTQLANMRPGDRQALAHLPLPQQRSIITKSLKQLKKARQLERRYQIATERSGNKTLMGRFVPDGPIRPNG